MGNFDHAGAVGEFFHQRVGGRAVGRIEIGVPLVEQIDRGVGMRDDLLQGFQLALARGESGMPPLARPPVRLLVIEVVQFVQSGLHGEAEGEPGQ